MDKQRLTANILFSGIGCQERGIIDSEVYDLDVLTTSEIDKEAVLIYATLHCGLTPRIVTTFPTPSVDSMIADLENMNIGLDVKTMKPYNWKSRRKQVEFIKKYWIACYISHNKGDISKIKTLPYADLWTCSFPCQSISNAGKLRGFKPDSTTRSSLLWENIRLLMDAVNKHKAPKYVMFENVKNLVGKKFINDFEILLQILEELGYNSYWKVLNATECGIPQNRERVFVICIRKDIDKHCFTFPEPFELKNNLEDMLDDNVDDKYYINQKREEWLLQKMYNDGTLQRIR